jgi:hypothetical protein
LVSLQLHLCKCFDRRSFTTRISERLGLAENSDFIEVVRRAAELASQTTKEEKLEALRNAVLNAATGIDLEADEEVIFLQLVDQLTISLRSTITPWFDLSPTQFPSRSIRCILAVAFISAS